MLFVAIAQHSPAQCPGWVKEINAQVNANMPKLPELAQKRNVKLVGMYVMVGAHKTIIVCDAPSYEAAEGLLDDAGFTGWNTIELSQAYPPEEVMKKTQIQRLR